MIIAQLNLSLIVTALIGVEFSQVCPQHDEHIAMQTGPADRSCSRVAKHILPIVNPEIFTSAWFFD